MKSEDRPSLEELFVGAVALAGEERSRFLESHCGDDSATRSQLEDLLRYHDEAGDFLEVPPITSVPDPVLVIERSGESEATPARIGHFRVERVLGTGGMGQVYLAESEQPRRWVALKVVRSGIGSESLRRRFEQEAQVVALLQHPGIAQLFEAGTADSGEGPQPYFAMEYVDGPTLTEYARRKALPTRDRLELFCRVCEAAEHAHRRGVVHRDLKPGNILVDAAGQPKILDFGVARLTDPETAGGTGVAATTLHTQAGQLIGTLSYMSPEQVAGNPGEVDARSDVYSLGVILFELLAGRLPHDVSRRSIPEAIRAIKEDAPTSLSSIDRAWRGDIETIVGRALEKEASRRYQSAAELASDIRRSLRDEPIVARPPSTWYQLSKFAKRNKALVGGVVATMLALSGGLVASVWQAREAEAARLDAQREATTAEKARDAEMAARIEAQKQAAAAVSARKSEEAARIEAQKQATAADLARKSEEAAKLEAQARAAEAEESRGAALKAKKSAEESLQVSQEVNAFLEQLCSSPDPDGRMGKDVTVMTVLDRSAKHLEEDLAAQPHVQAVLHRTIGNTYRTLTEYDKAGVHLRAAYDIDMQLYGERHDETLQSMTQLVLLLSEQAKNTEALRMAQKEWAIASEFFAPDNPERLVIASNLATVMMDADDWRGAEALQRYVLEERTKLLGADDPSVQATKNNLGSILAKTGRLGEAIALQREAVAAYRASGRPMDTKSFGVVLGLANSLLAARQDEEAGELAHELIEKGAALFSPDHNAMLTARNVQGQLLLHQGRAAEAEQLFRELIEAHRKSEIPAVDGLVRIKNNLGEALRSQGKLDEAEAEYREALRLLDTNEKVPDRLRISILNNLATTLRLKKDFSGVLPIYKELVETSEKVLAPDDWTIAVGRYGYGVTLMGLHRPEESEEQLQRAYDVAMKTFTEKDQPVIAIMRSFVNLYDLWKKPEKAEYWRQKLPEEFRHD